MCAVYSLDIIISVNISGQIYTGLIVQISTVCITAPFTGKRKAAVLFNPMTSVSLCFVLVCFFCRVKAISLFYIFHNENNLLL